MMKITLLLAALFLFTPGQDQSEIVGLWNMTENDTQIEIVKVGDSYTGTVIKSKSEKAIDKVILRDFTKDGEDWKGKFYAVKRDRLLDAKLKTTGDDSLELEITARGRLRKLKLERAK
ncbi:MAG: hypothetical protein AAFQ94_05225 [Bacteroidota bacterium]